MTGDIYIGRGSRKRDFRSSIWGDSYKVAGYGRGHAIQRFGTSLLSNAQLSSIGPFNRSPCEASHADSLIALFWVQSDDALNYLAKLREETTDLPK